MRNSFSSVMVVKDQLGAMAASLHRTGELLQSQCPGNAELAWVQLRLLELGAGRGTFPVGLRTPETDRRWRALAQEWTARAPDSAPLATMAARADGSVEAAQRAVRIGPDYAPAHAALAEALLRKGQPDKADEAMRQVRHPAALTDGYSLLARIRLARGDIAGAQRAARLVLAGRHDDPVEPAGVTTQQRIQAKEVMAQCHLRNRQYAQAARILHEIEPDSELAASLLARPDTHQRAELDKPSPAGNRRASH